MEAQELETALQVEIERLTAEFGARLPTSMIEQCVEESVAPFQEAKIKLFVPIFAYRSARERLRQLARADG
jgi:hypothetical protein